MYTSHIDINQDNVQAIQDIAQCLQVPNVQSLCNAFLKPCPPPVEIPTFSLPGMLNSEHDCLLGSSLPHEVDLHCPTEAQRPGFAGDLDPNKRVSVSVTNSSSETVGGSQAPGEKQLVHGYKLRNFYSKQYFKQTALQASSQGPSPPVVVEELPCQLGGNQGNNPPPVCSGITGHTNPPCTSPAVEKVTSLTPSDSLNTPSSDPPDSVLSRPVRPKKTVYLKKYNYLCSQKALEEMCAEAASEPTLSCPKESQQEEAGVRMGTPQPPAEVLGTGREDIPEAPTDAVIPLDEPQDPKAASEPPQPAGHKQHRCEVCGKIFKHPSNLELHKRSHTGNVCSVTLRRQVSQRLS